MSIYKKKLALLIIQSMRAGYREMRQRGMYTGEYAPNFQFWEVIMYMIENNLNSIVDLGAGIGHNLEMCRRLGMTVRGYETDVRLIHSAFDFVTPLDVEQIKPEDIAGFDVVYAFGPTRNQKRNDEFVKHVRGILAPDQVFAYFGMNDKTVNVYNEQSILQ